MRMNVLIGLRILALMIVSIGTLAQAADDLVILPAEVSLTGAESFQQLLLQRGQADAVREQLLEGVEWTSDHPEVVTVSGDGLLEPVADGTATITASQGDQSARVSVHISGTQQPTEWTFRNDVLPALTKAGCNQGACHGALAGKGGFKLSLRGYDPPMDFFNIVKQDRGRRVEFSDPGRSLVLAKPSGAVPHKGGLRLDPDSRDYRIFAEWISRGAAPPTSEDPVVESLRVSPSRVRLQSGQQQQALVQAHYSDGRTVDVTNWVKWTATNEAVCKVDDQGKITVVGPGEGAVTAWFSSRIVVSRVTVPYDNAVPANLFAELPARNFIDEEVNRQLARLNLPPSPLCNDSTFIRRVYLDTIGLVPTASEVQNFLADPAADKRDKLIEELLERPEFVDYWTYQWSDVLMLNGQLLRPQAIKAYYDWIHDNVEKNTPWDQFVSEILVATGDSFENGATNFYALFESPEAMTENACQAFMGLSIGCAKCHNHPLEKWTNDQYYAMANMFSRVQAKGWGGDKRNGDGKRTVFTVESGELVQPRTGKPQPPTPLDGEPLPFDDPDDRRVPLANWMTSPENPYFARAITNRVWANYFGTGLVEPVDDLRVSNPASNDELLQRSADFLIAEDFNLKSLMRAILQSQAYQRSSVPVAGNENDMRFYSRYVTRRLDAEVLHDGVVRVTKVPTEFDSIAYPGNDFQKTDFYPEGTRAIQLYDAAVDSYFLKAFGRNQRNIVCECERSNEPSMVQVLHISNGHTINDKLQSADGRIANVIAQMEQGLSAASVVDQAYLECLARYPRDEERTQFVAIISEAPSADRRRVVEDLYWALLSSREFLFNH